MAWESKNVTMEIICSESTHGNKQTGIQEKVEQGWGRPILGRLSERMGGGLKGRRAQAVAGFAVI